MKSFWTLLTIAVAFAGFGLRTTGGAAGPEIMSIDGRRYVWLDVSHMVQDKSYITDMRLKGDRLQVTHLNPQIVIIGKDGGKPDDPEPEPPEDIELEAAIQDVKDAFGDISEYAKAAGVVSFALKGMASTAGNYEDLSDFQSELKKQFDLAAGSSKWDSFWVWLTDIPSGFSVAEYAARCRRGAEAL